MNTKMYCIFAMESVKKMNGNRGKLASMSGHAFLHSDWDANRPIPDDVTSEELAIYQRKAAQSSDYRNTQRAYKITLFVDTVEELVALQKSYQDVCGTSLVTDAGFTVFKEPTTVSLGIGPIWENMIGEDLKALKVLL